MHIFQFILTVTVIIHCFLMIVGNVTELAELYAALTVLMILVLVTEYRCYKWLLVYQHLHYFVIS